MIGRRTLILAGASLAARPAFAASQAFPALPVPPGDGLAFRMIRHGTDIGRHTLSFEPQGDRLAVHVACDAVVTLLSVPIIRYTHRAVEVWQAGTLIDINGDTDKNGSHQWVRAHRDQTGLCQGEGL